MLVELFYTHKFEKIMSCKSTRPSTSYDWWVHEKNQSFKKYKESISEGGKYLGTLPEGLI